MRKKISYFILVILLAGIFPPSCKKKYEEGPLISFRSAEKRIYGHHELTSYTVDGADSLSQYFDSLGVDFNFIYDDIHNVNTCIMDGRRKDGAGTLLFWWWVLANNDESLIVKSSTGSSIGVGPFGINKTPVWKIQMLKFKKIKLSTVYSSKEYKIELTRN
jgi:hypothetical protein